MPNSNPYFLIRLPSVRRAIKGVLSDPTAEIARFKKDFDAMAKILITAATLSLTEGISEVKKDFYNIEEDVKDVKCEGKMHSLRDI